MTYSIVARDPSTAALGVAVQSHWFSVGSVVPWAVAGVGAVATQAFAEPAYGPDALELLAGGATAAEALSTLLAQDDERAVRQVAVLSAGGQVATHTGNECIPAAGHIAGPGWSCQANMMTDDGVPEAMAEAFARTVDEPLSGRLLAALNAAEAAGGDVRGRQSAALLVVPAEGAPWQRLIDVRVEDHLDPLGELRRLVDLSAAYDLASEGDELVAEERHEEAADRYERAAALAPDNDELRFWAALAAADRGELDHAAAVLTELVGRAPGWLLLLERLTPAIAPSAAQVLEALEGRR